MPNDRLQDFWISLTDYNADHTVQRKSGNSKVNLDESNKSEPMEARDVSKPFTKVALRGGSHAYSYNADGQFVGFTYNDLFLERESQTDPMDPWLQPVLRK